MRPTASSSPSAAPTSRSTARTGWSGSFVYEGKPEDEAIDTYALRAGGRGNPGLAAQKSTGRSPRATRTSSPAARRAYERQAELVASLQKGASPVSKLILKMSMSLDGFVADDNGD